MVLNRAAHWIGRFGTILMIGGAVLAILSEQLATSLPLLKMIASIAFWIVPGVVYLISARGLLRRRRWAITSAESTTYAQIGLAGLMILIALLGIKALWPMILIAAVWIAGLVQTPKRLAGLSAAMDQLAARVKD